MGLETYRTMGLGLESFASALQRRGIFAVLAVQLVDGLTLLCAAELFQLHVLTLLPVGFEVLSFRRRVRQTRRRSWGRDHHPLHHPHLSRRGRFHIVEYYANGRRAFNYSKEPKRYRPYEIAKDAYDINFYNYGFQMKEV